MLILARDIPNQRVRLPILEEKGIRLCVKREDLIHEHVSGNKFRKLKYNLVEAKKKKYTKVLTFGGAYSNHIAATAAAAKQYGLRSVGVIRGEELHNKVRENPTLRFAASQGMQLKFISRELYRAKTSETFLKEIRKEVGNAFILPEGGTNALAVKGCEEILTRQDKAFTHICAAVGTGGTLAGIINTAGNHQQVIGFPALKGGLLRDEIDKFANQRRYELVLDHHFGGYAKINSTLITFINEFKQKTNIPLDPVYTGKMMYGILDMVEKDSFLPGSNVLAIHTGGLQGIEGMNLRSRTKNLPIIST